MRTRIRYAIDIAWLDHTGRHDDPGWIIPADMQDVVIYLSYKVGYGYIIPALMQSVVI